MPELLEILSKVNVDKSVNKEQIVSDVENRIVGSGYGIVETNSQKPWGAYFKLSDKDAARFAIEFFDSKELINPSDDNNKLEISPKILLVSPGEILSWQYHNRRAELWRFINDGAYYNSLNDDEGELKIAKAGDIVQFSTDERHRLVGRAGIYTLVYEIWRHTDPNSPSDEDDIIRLKDKYAR
jgi:mannose-6-phosphate isomerase-like protein (cupin superfamily)